MPNQKSIIRGIFGKQSEVTVKYPIKADSEAEMIEWVALLRDKIEQYIPEGPPTPLFATPEELQAKVDDALASKKATVSSSSAAAVMGTGTGSVVLAADSSFSSTMHQGDVSHAPSTATTASPTRPSSSAIRSSFSPSATPSVLSRSNTTKSIPSAPPLDPHDDHHLYQYHLHQHHHPRGSTAISNSSSASSLSRSVSHNSGVGGGHNGFIQSRKSIRMMGGPRSATPLPPRPVTYCEDASDVENSSSMIMVHDVPKAAEI